jgi:hypothetical protein
MIGGSEEAQMATVVRFRPAGVGTSAGQLELPDDVEIHLEPYGIRWVEQIESSIEMEHVIPWTHIAKFERVFKKTTGQ